MPETSDLRMVNNREYKLSFSDEFSSESIGRFNGDNASFRNSLIRDDGTEVRNITENGEDQYYLDDNDTDHDVFRVEDGNLTIEAQKVDAETAEAQGGLEIASGMINTQGIFSQQYGFFEISAKLEGVEGAWPAFWLLPEDGSWPPEIDVFEVLGEDTDAIHQNSHGAGSDDATTYEGIDASDGFHVYGLEWTPESLIWSVDGQVTRVEDNFINQEMFLVANLAMGGWAGSVSEDFDGAKMEIDYVRAYEVTTPWPDADSTAEEGEKIVGDKNSANDMEGTIGDDHIVGGALSDILVAGEGNDRIISGSGDDVISGGQGNDLIRSGQGDDIIFADGDADRVIAGQGDDVIYGGTGNDRITANAGDDTVYGQDGSDTISLGKDSDRAFGGSGNDMIRGGQGDDYIDGGAGGDILQGSRGDDTLLGNTGDDRLAGGRGLDVLAGGEGEDILHGGRDDDRIYGDAGDDKMKGEAGSDILMGGVGKDWMSGGSGMDELHGGADADTLHGNSGSDKLFGGGDDDAMYGGSGYDYMRGGDGNDKMYGEAQNDIMHGDSGDDTLHAGSGNDTVHGGEGDDRLFGNAGNDTLTDGAGNDMIVAGTGNDRIELGAGSDHVWTDGFSGDQHNDVVVVTEGIGEDYLHDFLLGSDQLDLSALDTDWTSLKSAMKSKNGDLLIDLEQIGGQSGDKLVLKDVDMNSISENEFVF